MIKWVSKSGTFLQFTIYVVLAAALWIPAFVNPAPAVITADDGPLYLMLISWLNGLPLLTIGLTLLLIVFQSFVVFYLYQSNGFFNRTNFVPAIIVLIGYSWNSSFQTLHALIPALVFVLIALNSLLRMYGRQAPYQQVFTAAFSISIASLFYLPLVYLVLLIWFVLISYRVSFWREYLITLIGFALPWIYYLSWLYLTDSILVGIAKVAHALFEFVLPNRLTPIHTIWLLFSVFVVIITMIATLNTVSDKLISIRRRAWVLFVYCIAALIVILFSGWPILSANYIFVVPLSFFITGSISMLKRTFTFEILILLYFLIFAAMRIFWGL